MRYRLKFKNGRWTLARFTSWDHAESYAKAVFGKHWENVLDIVATNGIPF